jgi:Aldo/keto reductases, related to diketogulonate reductase
MKRILLLGACVLLVITSLSAQNKGNRQKTDTAKEQSLYVTLANGQVIPRLCYGTWQTPAGEVTYNGVSEALKVGYRHIDTAFDYGNEQSIGEAVRNSGIPRSEIFITTKLSASVKTYEGAKAAINQSLANLGLDYIDIYIIHAPWPWANVGEDYNKANVEVWRAMEEAYKEGKLKSIGLSNFNIADVQNILNNCSVKPVVNEVKVHVGNYPRTLVDFCKNNDIVVMGYSTLSTGALIGREDIQQIADRYGVTLPQLCIRYSLQHGVTPLVKSLKPTHMAENLKVNFTISDDDMKVLDKLPNYSIGKFGPPMPYEGK